MDGPCQGSGKDWHDGGKKYTHVSNGSETGASKTYKDEWESSADYENQEFSPGHTNRKEAGLKNQRQEHQRRDAVPKNREA